MIEQAVGVGYTIATGRLFCDIAEFHRVSEELLGRPVWTHEFGDQEVWVELRSALEARLTQEMRVTA